MYLYRAVDPDGQTIDFMLSAKRDPHATKRFFRKVIQPGHAASLYVMNVDKYPAFPMAFEETQPQEPFVATASYGVSDISTMWWSKTTASSSGWLDQ
jgi:transposase-like protein